MFNIHPDAQLCGRNAPQARLFVPHRRLLQTLSEVLAAAHAAAQPVGLNEARLFAADRLAENEQLTALSAKRIVALWTRFERFALANEVRLVDQVTPRIVDCFVHALTSERREPSVATMHLRRASVRLLFKVLREFAICGADPTVDVALPPRSGLAVRPLTDDEVELCRWAALATVTSTRQPAVWALGEAGASTCEVAKVAAADLDLDGQRVWLGGGPRTDPRWASLTTWGATQLARRQRHMRAHGDEALAFDHVIDAYAGRISAGAAFTAVLGRAGLAGEGDVRPRSLTAWVGRRIWLQTARIDEVARRLGLRSLDLTAELIGLAWRDAEVEA